MTRGRLVSRMDQPPSAHRLMASDLSEMLSYDTERGGYVVNLGGERLRYAPHHGEDFPDYDHPFGRPIFTA